MQEEHGGAGVYSADLRKHYIVEHEEWRHDIMPEIMDGHNVFDFVDADIDAKLAELERDEAEAEVRGWGGVCGGAWGLGGGAGGEGAGGGGC